jgi:hypothetical protein
MPKVKEDRTMRTMREFGFTGPITRQGYLDFIHATDDPQEPSADLESMLPEHLQDWDQFHQATPAPRKKSRRRPALFVVHPQEDVLMKIRQERFPHLTEAEWQKKRLEVIEMASVHGF